MYAVAGVHFGLTFGRLALSIIVLLAGTWILPEASPSVAQKTSTCSSSTGTQGTAGAGGGGETVRHTVQFRMALMKRAALNFRNVMLLCAQVLRLLLHLRLPPRPPQMRQRRQAQVMLWPRLLVMLGREGPIGDCRCIILPLS